MLPTWCQMGIPNSIPPLCFQGRMLTLMNMKFRDVLTLVSTGDSAYP